MASKKRLTRGEAIKKYCKESCCAGSNIDWRECSTYDCFLWRYRLGGEIHGNSKSFTKTRAKALKSSKNNTSGETSKPVQMTLQGAGK